MLKKKFYETEAFQNVKDEWYSKLEASGFEDIETGSDEYVVERQKFKSQKVQSESGLDYYEYCNKILRDYPFPDTYMGEVHKVIFELHTEGKSVRDIKEDLIAKGYKKLSHVSIHNIINKIKEEFGRS